MVDLYDDDEIYLARGNELEYNDTQDCDEVKELCNHTEVFETDEGTTVCRECGCEVDQLDFEAEWRYYGASDNKSSADPSRCHSHTEHYKNNIDSVFSGCKMVVPLAIRKKTEQKYKMIVGDDTVRGKGRKAIVAASLLHVYLEEGDIRTSDEIRGMFGLTKQQMSDGISRYYETFPKDRTRYCPPKDLISRVMFRTGVDKSHYDKIYSLAKILESADEVLKHSNPNSVASSIVFLYLCLNKKLYKSMKMSKITFANLAGLSDMTISKLTKRSASLLDVEVDF